MRITKLEHSGIILEKSGQKVVFDPVEFENKLPELDNVVAVVITHKHGDHLQREKLGEIVAQNPGVKVFTTSDTVSELPYAEVVRQGDVRQVGGFELKFFGENHAEIVPGVIPCQNIGAVVDEVLVNPGDSFDMPGVSQKTKVLLVPSAAPWCKVPEGMDYIERVKPEIVIPVHNAVLSKLGNNFNNNLLKQTCDEIGAELAALNVNESMEV